MRCHSVPAIVVYDIINTVHMSMRHHEQGQHVYATSRSTYARDIMNKVNMHTQHHEQGQDVYAISRSTHVRDIMNMVNTFFYLRNIKVNICTRHHEHGQPVFLFTQHQGQHMYVRS